LLRDALAADPEIARRGTPEFQRSPIEFRFRNPGRQIANVDSAIGQISDVNDAVRRPE
jgi:hypothetical protein